MHLIKSSNFLCNNFMVNINMDQTVGWLGNNITNNLVHLRCDDGVTKRVE